MTDPFRKNNRRTWIMLLLSGLLVVAAATVVAISTRNTAVVVPVHHSTPTPSHSLTPLPTVAPTPTPLPLATQAQLVAVAKGYYAPDGSTCQAGQSGTGAQLYAQCPFTADLKARYAAFAPRGEGGVQNGEQAGGYSFLCHCQINNSAVGYDTTASGSGGTVVITTNATPSTTFTVTLISSGGSLLISDIKYTDGANCNMSELDSSCSA